MISYMISYLISYQISYGIVHTDIAYDIIICEEVYMISYMISYVISYCISYDILHTAIAYDIIVHIILRYHTYDIADDIIVKTMISQPNYDIIVEQGSRWTVASQWSRCRLMAVVFNLKVLHGVLIGAPVPEPLPRCSENWHEFLETLARLLWLASAQPARASPVGAARWAETRALAAAGAGCSSGKQITLHMYLDILGYPRISWDIQCKQKLEKSGQDTPGYPFGKMDISESGHHDRWISFCQTDIPGYPKICQYLSISMYVGLSH